jgi:hypothetical protein
MNSNEAVFDSTRSAVVFAFNFSMQQYGESLLAKMQRSRAGSGKGLVGLDGAGQAGMVLAQIERLSPTERAAIVARFSPRCEPCPCCGGEKPIAVWREAIEHLASVCIPVGVSNIRCRRDLVAKHFGVKVRFEDLAERYAMSRNTVGEHYRLLTRRLADIESQAQTFADEALRSHGMVADA